MIDIGINGRSELWILLGSEEHGLKEQAMGIVPLELGIVIDGYAIRVAQQF